MIVPAEQCPDWNSWVANDDVIDTIYIVAVMCRARRIQGEAET